MVESVSSETVRRILSHHNLKPWRHHMWLSPKHPRDEAFYHCASALIDIYTRPMAPNEMALCFDEKTSLQPRPRLQPTKPAQKGNIPNRVEHEYKRDGALHLFAAFNTSYRADIRTMLWPQTPERIYRFSGMRGSANS
jgi:hypothetical protein